jgi:GntR family transcriptional regulator/MocR family aminotransferase
MSSLEIYGSPVVWQIALALAPEDPRPVFLQIAHAIAAEIQRGRLRAGDALPSTRKLATELDTHRKTVTAAYRELASQGWIAITPAKGARVTADVPALAARRSEPVPASRAWFDLRPSATQPAGPIPRHGRLLLLLGGVPELRFVPQLALGRAYRSVLASTQARSLLDYGDPQGDPQLREQLAEMLRRTRGIPATPQTVAVLRGSQHALYLAARTLLRPGDRVAVEALGYPPAWNALRLVGAELEPIAVDAGGLDVAALEAVCENKPIRAIYVTPHHQVPTTVTLGAARRLRLLDLARRRRIAILEDDHDHEFQYEGRPVLPLAAADHHGVVIYLGSLSKILAPGLRLGYLVATPDVIARIVGYRTLVDQQGDHVVERALAELMLDGTLVRHVRKARRAYRGRRDALCAALAAQLPELTFTPPHGGMAVWARAPSGVDVAAWAERAFAAGVAFQPGQRFAVTGRVPHHARIGFAACTEHELVEAVRRMAATYTRR